ncbi:MAG TPA: glycosyltransferase family 39 protein, partial [Roseivirga sp.]
MKNLTNLLLLKATPNRQLSFLFGFITLVYFYHFDVNDIWTPNESFYAEAVREMFESGNFLEISYNYEPRYNKPPLTYWAMALSVSAFGMTEFALRLPILLMGLGSIWLTYLLGKLIYGHKGGLFTMLMMAFSLQLLAVKQYASPEIPLTFFFTLTLYWFLKGYQTDQFKYILLAYIALGLTVLTKGYPYIIVIGGIISLYILWDNWLKKDRFWSKLKLLKLQLGIPIVLLIGLSWIIFMYLKDGEEFWLVYKRETF